MPECFFLTVCAGSALDAYTNQWSLFSLLDQLVIGGAAAPTPEKPVFITADVHTYWSFKADEHGNEYEWRLVSCVGGEEAAQKAVYVVKAAGERVRHRVMGLWILHSGSTTLRVEWRKKGKGEEKWTRSNVVWPVRVDFVKDPTPEQMAAQLGKEGKRFELH
jgi:hypothetical protein